MTDFQGLTEPLSEREIEILKCLVEGLTNRGIANRLHLAHQTVKGYNSEIYRKLGVNNRDDVIERARALGLLETDSGAAQPAGKHNLPESVTRFIGRKQEIQDLLQLLGGDDYRLITILAPGGMGKTRLSIEFARTQIDLFSDGVYFVPLAPLGSPDDMVTTIAEDIGCVFHGENPPQQQLLTFLKDREMLLVLDNFEHLLDGAALVGSMVQLTPYVKVIVTSRERLNLQGETVYPLRGLEFPTWETPEDALEYDAVQLFMACWANGYYAVVANSAESRLPNRWEPEDRRFPGWAGVFSPWRRVIHFVDAEGNDESLVVEEISSAELEDRRSHPNFLAKELRNELYCFG